MTLQAGDIVLVVVSVVFFVILIAGCVYFLVYFQHPDDKVPLLSSLLSSLPPSCPSCPSCPSMWIFPSLTVVLWGVVFLCPYYCLFSKINYYIVNESLPPPPNSSICMI